METENVVFAGQKLQIRQRSCLSYVFERNNEAGEVGIIYPQVYYH